MQIYKTIKVELGERSYPISIGSDLLENMSALPGVRLENRSALMITDQTVESIFGEKLATSTAVASRLGVFSFPPGESSKNLKTYSDILSFAAASGTDRKSLVIALGGGVPGDIAGFVAATYMRGLDFIQIPTTLLAMVDSSVGGKTAVDLPEGKNLAGAFWQPKSVIIDTDTLDSLPPREFACGMAEVIKYGVIMDGDFFSFIESSTEKIKGMDRAILAEIVARSCELKAAVVAGDEREESGLRAILNYGHSFGHAIEMLSGYGRYRHGEAVSIGMVLAAKFAVMEGRLCAGSMHRIRSLLEEFSLPVSFDGISAASILDAMRRDKKSTGGNIKLVLPDKIGSVSLVKCDEKAILECLKP